MKTRSFEGLERLKVSHWDPFRSTLCADSIWLVVVSLSTLLAKLLQPWGEAVQSHRHIKKMGRCQSFLSTLDPPLTRPCGQRAKFEKNIQNLLIVICMPAGAAFAVNRSPRSAIWHSAWCCRASEVQQRHLLFIISEREVEGVGGVREAKSVY